VIMRAEDKDRRIYAPRKLPWRSYRAITSLG
jgi:hypothetical protein